MTAKPPCSILAVMVSLRAARLPPRMDHPQRVQRVVSITIDDLPVSAVSVSSDWASVTTRLLAALRHHNAPAVGFVNETKLYVDGVLDSSRVASGRPADSARAPSHGSLASRRVLFRTEAQGFDERRECGW